MIIRFQLQPCNCSPPRPFHHLAPLDLYTLNFSPPVASPSVFLPSLVTYFPLLSTPLFPISLCHFFLPVLVCPLFLLSSHLSFLFISSSPHSVFSPAFYSTCLLLPLFHSLISPTFFCVVFSLVLFHSILSSTPPVLLSCVFVSEHSSSAMEKKNASPQMPEQISSECSVHCTLTKRKGEVGRG